jgi:hypothetical protein
MAGMETTKTSRAHRVTNVVTEGSAQAALRRGPATKLLPEEERVLRMRLGASPPRTAPLERSVEDLSDLEIELLSYEIEGFMKARAHAEARSGLEAARAPAAPRLPAPRASRTKEKIVRALWKKV